jgi:hypothetical protein
VFGPDRRPVALSEDLTLPGWKFGDPTLEVVGNRYDTDFGDPTTADPVYSPGGGHRAGRAPAGALRDQAVPAVAARGPHRRARPLGAPALRGGRIGIGITALLTLVALQITSWVDATGDVARAARADRRGPAVLTAWYFLAAALISVFFLT